MFDFKVIVPLIFRYFIFTTVEAQPQTVVIALQHYLQPPKRAFLQSKPMYQRLFVPAESFAEFALPDKVPVVRHQLTHDR